MRVERNFPVRPDLLARGQEDRQMAMVMIVCPRTGRDVPTGIETDPSSFESFGAAAPLKCPACGRAHAWSKANAWLAGSLGAMEGRKFRSRTGEWR